MYLNGKFIQSNRMPYYIRKLPGFKNKASEKNEYMIRRSETGGFRVYKKIHQGDEELWHDLILADDPKLEKYYCEAEEEPEEKPHKKNWMADFICTAKSTQRTLKKEGGRAKAPHLQKKLGG